MQAIDPTQLILTQLNWRYATKQFDPNRTIDAAQWTAIEDALSLTPSSYGLQPWKFVVVTNPEVRRQLLAHSWNQSQIVDASHLVVFAAKKEIGEADLDHYLSEIAKARGIDATALAGFRGMLVGAILDGMNEETRRNWAAKQAYIALGNFLNVTALLGVDACPMEGFLPAKYDEILGLDKEGYTAAVIATAGFRSDEDSSANHKKFRFAKTELFERI